MGNAMAVCDVKDVSHGYPHAGMGKEELFKNVKLVVEKGERVALIGPNGCGNTCLKSLREP
jgi:ATPase subunit of ABC transporter with duplicated ATPase domains